jgi:hypothetical protein
MLSCAIRVQSAAAKMSSAPGGTPGNVSWVGWACARFAAKLAVTGSSHFGREKIGSSQPSGVGFSTDDPVPSDQGARSRGRTGNDSRQTDEEYRDDKRTENRKRQTASRTQIQTDRRKFLPPAGTYKRRTRDPNTTRNLSSRGHTPRIRIPRRRARR